MKTATANTIHTIPMVGLPAADHTLAETTEHQKAALLLVFISAPPASS
jgi:hypothetical protein